MKRINRLVLAVLVVFSPSGGWALDKGDTCGNLVTEQECLAYLDGLRHARTADERTAMKRLHMELLQERARLCPNRKAETGGFAIRDARDKSSPKIRM